MTAMKLVLPNDKVYSGADALPEILCRLGGWRWLEMILRWPVIKKLSPIVYQWIARHRGFLSCVFRPKKKKDIKIYLDS